MEAKLEITINKMGKKTKVAPTRLKAKMTLAK